MARRKAAETADEGQGEQPKELVKCAVINPRTIINGHVLDAGTVIGLTAEEIENHRERGVALDDVAEDDDREVFDVQTPYEAKDEGDQ